jgi:hypothetical protein
VNRPPAESSNIEPAAVLPILKGKGQDPVYENLLKMVEKGTLRSGPPSRTVEIGGTPYSMTLEQYRRYLDASSAAARPRLARLFESSTWEKTDAKRQSEAVSAIVSAARKVARQKVKMEIVKTGTTYFRSRRRLARASFMDCNLICQLS